MLYLRVVYCILLYQVQYVDMKVCGTPHKMSIRGRFSPPRMFVDWDFKASVCILPNKQTWNHYRQLVPQPFLLISLSPSLSQTHAKQNHHDTTLPTNPEWDLAWPFQPWPPIDDKWQQSVVDKCLGLDGILLFRRRCCRPYHGLCWFCHSACE